MSILKPKKKKKVIVENFVSILLCGFGISVEFLHHELMGQASFCSFCILCAVVDWKVLNKGENLGFSSTLFVAGFSIIKTVNPHCDRIKIFTHIQ